MKLLLDPAIGTGLRLSHRAQEAARLQEAVAAEAWQAALGAVLHRLNIAATKPISIMLDFKVIRVEEGEPVHHLVPEEDRRTLRAAHLAHETAVRSRETAERTWSAAIVQMAESIQQPPWLKFNVEDDFSAVSLTEPQGAP